MWSMTIDKPKIEAEKKLMARCICCGNRRQRKGMSNQEFILGRGCRVGVIIPGTDPPVRKHMWVLEL